MTQLPSLTARHRAVVITAGALLGLGIALLGTRIYLDWSDGFGPTARTYLQVAFFLLAPILLALMGWIISLRFFVAYALAASLVMAIAGTIDNLDVYESPSVTEFVVQAMVFFTMGAFLPLTAAVVALLGVQHRHGAQADAAGHGGVR